MGVVVDSERRSSEKGPGGPEEVYYCKRSTHNGQGVASIPPEPWRELS
jgi:hypothetical protein